MVLPGITLGMLLFSKGYYQQKRFVGGTPILANQLNGFNDRLMNLIIGSKG
ncbi:hypothetical protein RJD24_12390 [Bacillaceae bacterium IKA-2]|nr:hypothetical protein RJD24_12390 [Bacillaceae bacterium IKA-2]